MHHFRNTYPTNTNTIGGYLIPDDEDNNTVPLAEINIAALQLTAPTNLSTVSIPYSYRYGFNGQEREQQLNQSITSAEYWFYDSRLGRRWNVDPMTGSYPWQSPYAAFNNNPLYFADPLGLKGVANSGNGAPEETGSENAGDMYVDKESIVWYTYQCGTTNSADDGWIAHPAGDLLNFNYSRFEDACYNKAQEYPGPCTFLGFYKGLGYIGYDLGTMPEGVGNTGNWSEIIGTDECGDDIFGEKTGDWVATINPADYPDMSTGESMVPVWGSGKQAYYNLQDGNYGSAALNTLMAVSDLFLAKSLYSGGSKFLRAGMKKSFGIGYSHNYGATVSRWKRAGISPEGVKHHWLISQEMMTKYPSLKPIGNQLWNITSFPTQASHMRWAHFQTYQDIGYWYSPLLFPVTSTPTWFKSSVFSIGLRFNND